MQRAKESIAIGEEAKICIKLNHTMLLRPGVADEPQEGCSYCCPNVTQRWRAKSSGWPHPEPWNECSEGTRTDFRKFSRVNRSTPSHSNCHWGRVASTKAMVGGLASR